MRSIYMEEKSSFSAGRACAFAAKKKIRLFTRVKQPFSSCKAFMYRVELERYGK